MERKSARGFSLIELVVVLVIIMAVTGGAITAFTRFREVRLVDNEAKQVYDLLRLAQTKSLAGEKPSGCIGELRGYKVNFGTKKVTALVSCNADTKTNEVTLVTADVRSSGGNLLFLPITGATKATLIEVYKGETVRQIEVTEAGGIGAYLEGRVLPTTRPNSQVTSCLESCLSQGNVNGTCRRNEASCTIAGETYSSAGDQYCFGVNGSCCCRVPAPTPTPTPGRAIDSCDSFCAAAGFSAGICNPKYIPGTNPPRVPKTSGQCANYGAVKGSAKLVRATSADKYCTTDNPYCCCY